MSNVVLVFLVEFVIGHSAERFSPKHDRLFDRKAKHLEKSSSVLLCFICIFTHFQEQTILQTSIVFEMVISHQAIMERPHTHWEVLLGQIIDHLGFELLYVLSSRIGPFRRDTR